MSLSRFSSILFVLTCLLAGATGGFAQVTEKAPLKVPRDPSAPPPPANKLAESKQDDNQTENKPAENVPTPNESQKEQNQAQSREIPDQENKQVKADEAANQASVHAAKPVAGVPVIPQPAPALNSAPPSAAELLSEKPPLPPKITFAQGQLTIVANNSTLGDVIGGFCKATGAKQEGDVGAATERVFGQFGPDVPAAVLDALLKGSSYGFIAVGDPDDPGSVKQLILLSRSTALVQNGVAAQSPQPPQPYETPASYQANYTNAYKQPPVNNPDPEPSRAMDQMYRDRGQPGTSRPIPQHMGAVPVTPQPQ
ncbi:MAG TPA: hypothetical protein VKZ53_17340 [Candidatus Angelobacter sp.]|nr:hypothetical protein [Candidatus Angelobacter sp.]